ncbi:uncharacterized protein LOC135494716 isoform X1 [Lineus longissimus]|uniref:uncharacterized protein LOC135494716 isoform X1 n=1 Tax=Lineus longissimus TaxID=88925 RepID=UPI002B4F74F2
MEDQNVLINGGLRNAEVKTYHTLPLVRYTTGLRCLALLDLVTVVVLWLAGGESSYLKESILRYNFLTSVFDVAAISTIKTIAIFIILEKLETISMVLLEQPFCFEKANKKFAYHIFLLLLCLVPFMFFVIKGAFVLHNYLNSAVTMHLQYNISLVSAVTFAALELLLAMGSHHFMKRLQLLRIRHVVSYEGPQSRQKKTANFIRFVLLLKDEWLLLVVATIFDTFANILGPQQPKYTGRAVDDALESLDKFKTTMLTLGGICLAHFVSSGIKSLCFHLASQKLMARWRTVAFQKLMKQGMEFYYENLSGEFASRLSGDIARIYKVINDGDVIQFFVGLVQIGLVLYNMFAINPKMTGLFLASSPLWITNIALYGKWQKKLWHSFQAKLARAVATAEVYINAVWTVKCLGEERQSIDEYSEDIRQSYLVGRKLAVVKGLCVSLNYGVGYLTEMVVLLYGGLLLNAGNISPGDFTSMIMYVHNISSVMNNQQVSYGSVMEAYGASLRLIEIIDLKVEDSDESSIQSEMSFEEISFQAVRYSYCARPGRGVLNGVSFTLRKGEVVAMVGPSGGGKSTIASLMPRLCSSDIGKITIDNIDINTIDSGYLRRHVTLVDQSSMLSGGTIRENMTRMENVSMAEIEQASHCAQAHDFINSFQDGYDTFVGERGMLLSGGEKQRIAIARALLTRPKVLILDEATSYLDVAMEDSILIAVGQAVTARGGIVIFMSSKSAVVNTANRVILVNGGKTRELDGEEIGRQKESARQTLACSDSLSER